MTITKFFKGVLFLILVAMTGFLLLLLPQFLFSWIN